ncbi:hypothetical protein PC116_g34479 [Phytophthora cactorum]|nr:hypothetical protein PC116_g34479 [Phytophthora cactorum]
MRLEDVQNLTALTDTRSGIGTAFARLEVDEKTQGFLLGRHKVYDTLEHENEMLDLAGRDLRVLAARVQVMAGAAVLIVAQQDLFPSGILGSDVLGGQFLYPVFSSPSQSFL